LGSGGDEGSCALRRRDRQSGSNRMRKGSLFIGAPSS
jgi:hypothetical protein